MIPDDDLDPDTWRDMLLIFDQAHCLRAELLKFPIRGWPRCVLKFISVKNWISAFAVDSLIQSIVSSQAFDDCLNALRSGWLESFETIEFQSSCNHREDWVWLNAELGDYPELQRVEERCFSDCIRGLKVIQSLVSRGQNSTSYRIIQELSEKGNEDITAYDLAYRNVGQDVLGAAWYRDLDLVNGRTAILAALSSACASDALHEFRENRDVQSLRVFVSATVSGEITGMFYEL